VRKVLTVDFKFIQMKNQLWEKAFKRKVKNFDKRKLKSKGFILKVCQNCGHFESCPDGTIDLLKGVCKIKGNPDNPETAVQTLIWNTCQGFMPQKISNIINDMANKNKPVV